MTFQEVLAQVITWLEHDKRLSYRALQRQFDLDAAYLDDLKLELIEVKQLAVDQDGTMLVWTGDKTLAALPASPQDREPLSYMPPHLAEKILTARRDLAGQRGTGADPLCGTAVRAGKPAPGPGAGRNWAWSGGSGSGRAGVGKSCLVYEFMHSHRTQGWLVLESASVSYGKATPYFPVLDLLRRYAHVEEHDDTRTVRAKVTGQVLTLDETLQDTVPALLALLDALPEDSPFLRLDPSQRRQRILAALKRVLLRASQGQSLLLVCEDLHWIDAETQALLDSLVESLPTARLLLLVNYRPEYQHGWGSKTYYTQLRLDPLPLASADEFLQALLGDDPSLEPLKRLLIARTEGNPFFLEESVRTLMETGVLVGEWGAYRLAQARPTIQVPATVQAVLAARIDRLPPEEKRLLQTAAVIGTEASFALLRAIAELPEEALHRALAHLQAAEFLYETHLFPEPEYTFKHALTHEVAYESLLMTRRQALHVAAGQALETLYAQRLEDAYERLAYHYARTDNVAKAVAYLTRVAEKAAQHSAHVEAISPLPRRWSCCKGYPPRPRRGACPAGQVAGTARCHQPRTPLAAVGPAPRGPSVAG